MSNTGKDAKRRAPLAALIGKFRKTSADSEPGGGDFCVSQDTTTSAVVFNKLFAYNSEPNKYWKFFSFWYTLHVMVCASAYMNSSSVISKANNRKRRRFIEKELVNAAISTGAFYYAASCGKSCVDINTYEQSGEFAHLPIKYKLPSPVTDFQGRGSLTALNYGPTYYDSKGDLALVTTFGDSKSIKLGKVKGGYDATTLIAYDCWFLVLEFLYNTDRLGVFKVAMVCKSLNSISTRLIGTKKGFYSHAHFAIGQSLKEIVYYNKGESKKGVFELYSRIKLKNVLFFLPATITSSQVTKYIPKKGDRSPYLSRYIYDSRSRGVINSIMEEWEPWTFIAQAGSGWFWRFGSIAFIVGGSMCYLNTKSVGCVLIAEYCDPDLVFNVPSRIDSLIDDMGDHPFAYFVFDSAKQFYEKITNINHLAPCQAFLHHDLESIVLTPRYEMVIANPVYQNFFDPNARGSQSPFRRAYTLDYDMSDCLNRKCVVDIKNDPNISPLTEYFIPVASHVDYWPKFSKKTLMYKQFRGIGDEQVCKVVLESLKEERENIQIGYPKYPSLDYELGLWLTVATPMVDLKHEEVDFRFQNTIARTIGGIVESIPVDHEPKFSPPGPLTNNVPWCFPSSMVTRLFGISGSLNGLFTFVGGAVSDNDYWPEEEEPTGGDFDIAE